MGGGRIDKAEIGKRVKKAADMLEVGPLLQRKPKQLSGGQRQRVAMGRAIVREPQVFLMDEPLSNLDAKLRVQMRAEIAAVQQDLNITTLYVTHDQIEAMTMGDRVAVLKAGVLMQVGAPQHLYDLPDNIFVAGFIGSVVHFDVDAPKVVTEDTKLLEKDSGAEEVPHHADATRFVASFAPRSRVKVGDEIQVVVDTERMHFFDPSTGDAVRE